LIRTAGPRIFKNGQTGLHLINLIRDVRGVGVYGEAIAEITIDYTTAEKNNLP
jgi:hypothetical protein